MAFVLDASAVVEYLKVLLSNSLSGDPVSIIIIAGAAILVLALVFGVSSLLFGLVRRFFLFIVIALSAYFFFSAFTERLVAEGLTIELIIIGVLGVLFAVAAVVIALKSLFRQAEYGPSAPVFTPTQLQQPHSYTTQALTRENLVNSLKDDRSLLAVLSYVIIAQFGVFSSKTTAAPNPEIGLVFAGIFFVGALIFIKTTYHSYAKGLAHLITASVFGIILSMALGLFWGKIPAETLFSVGYFATDALVAFITGIAVSLLMGTKH